MILRHLVCIMTFGLTCFSQVNAGDSIPSYRYKFSWYAGVKAFNPYADFNPIFDGAPAFPLIAGLNFGKDNAAFALDARFAVYFAPAVLSPDNLIAERQLVFSLGGNFLLSRNHRSGFLVGLGGLFCKRQNFFTANYGWPDSFYGAYLSLGYRYQQNDFEFRAEPDQQSILNGDHFSFGVVHHFGKQERAKPGYGPVSLGFIGGVRMMFSRYYEYSSASYSPLAFTPEYGLRFSINKIGTALEARHNFWIALNPGARRNEIKGFADELLLGFTRKYHGPVLTMRYGLYHAWHCDKSALYTRNYSAYYPERAMAFLISTPIRSFDLELRGTFPYHFDKALNGPKPNWLQMLSIGLYYKMKYDRN